MDEIQVTLNDLLDKIKKTTADESGMDVPAEDDFGDKKELKGLSQKEVKQLKLAFDEIDVNNDGSLDVYELRALLIKLGEEPK